MKKKLFVLLAIVMVLSIVSITTFAGPPEDAEGVWYYRPTGPPGEKFAGGNTFLTISDEGYWTGTFAGDSTDIGKVAIHSKGHWIYKGVVTFASVTVAGKTGGLEMRVQGRRPNALAEWDGKWVITGSSGDLAGLQGQGTWWGPGWLGDPTVYGIVSYSGNIHFESD